MSTSLLKYENALAITTSTKNPSKLKQQQSAATVPDMKKTPSTLQTEDVLAAILPPKEWEQDGKLWVQKVSSAPSSRLDVIALQDQLDSLLQKRQARETGLCPVRRELYDECFDEIIRQVAISCQERGLLLLRVRDELRMTILAYQTLYESSIAFGMRKALVSEEKKSNLADDVAKLEEEKKKLEEKLTEMQLKCDTIEKREAEKRQVDEKKHSEEMALLKKTNAQLKAQLDSILNPKNLAFFVAVALGGPVRQFNDIFNILEYNTYIEPARCEIINSFPHFNDVEGKSYAGDKISVQITANGLFSIKWDQRAIQKKLVPGTELKFGIEGPGPEGNRLAEVSADETQKDLEINKLLFEPSIWWKSWRDDYIVIYLSGKKKGFFYNSYDILAKVKVPVKDVLSILLKQLKMENVIDVNAECEDRLSQLVSDRIRSTN